MSLPSDGTGVEGGRRDRRPPGVHRERHVEAVVQCRDHRHDAVELLGLGHLRAGPGLHAPHVQDVGALFDQAVRTLEETVQVEVGPVVIEGIGRAVQDAHDECPGRKVVAALPESEPDRMAGAADGATGQRHASGSQARAGQNSREASARRYCSRLGSDGSIVSSRSSSSWRASSSVFARSSRSSRRGSSTAAPAPLARPAPAGCPADRQPGERGHAARLDGVGDLCEQAERFLRLAAPDEDLGQADDGAGEVRLELERPPKRRLVAAGDQLFGLARGRDEAAHELPDGRLGERADEPVDDLPAR